MLVCKGCEQKFYRDRQCAKDHWKRGGHKDMCAGLQAQQAKVVALGKHGPDPAVVGGGGAAAGGGGGAAPSGGRKSPLEAAAKVEHECPICMDNADDACVDGVGAGQCFACGQLFCGQCKPQLAANVANCPNCRAPFHVPEEKNVARLLEMVKRTPGRHTPYAQNNLGVVYANGRGVPQDYTEAVKWSRLAADQGHAHAQFNLGVAYKKGEGVAQDYVEAVKWYRLAAAQGLAVAQFNLGVMYANGRGVPQDHVEAVKWYRLAADQGHADAQFNLGLMYAQGEGVPQDYAEAVKWYRLAADQGHATAQSNLGLMHTTGQGVPQDLTKAARLFKLAAEQGNATAITSLPIILHQHLFPPGTKVELVGLKAVALNGKRGVVVAPSGAAAPALGRIAVELEGGGGIKAIPCEKLQTLLSWYGGGAYTVSE